MKTVKALVLVAVVAMMAGTIAYGDLQWNGNDDTTSSIYRLGNVGIGLSGSNAHYKDSARVVIKSTSERSIMCIRDTNLWYIGTNGSNGFGFCLKDTSTVWGYKFYLRRTGKMQLGGYSSTDTTYQVRAQGGFKCDSIKAKKLLLTSTSANDSILLRVSGKVSIGTADSFPKVPGTTLLAVGGTIRAKEVLVSLNWGDYVFNADYKLKPLGEVEQFINENKHLPGLPSEKEVHINGIGLGELNSTLLKKVEELTLYMIQMKKENEELKARVQRLEN